MDRHPTRWIRTAWLASLCEGVPSRARTLTTQAARAALEAIDGEDTARLVACLASIEAHAVTWPARDLAAGARRCVEQARAAQVAP